MTTSSLCHRTSHEYMYKLEPRNIMFLHIKCISFFHNIHLEMARSVKLDKLIDETHRFDAARGNCYREECTTVGCRSAFDGILHAFVLNAILSKKEVL